MPGMLVVPEIQRLIFKCLLYNASMCKNSHSQCHKSVQVFQCTTVVCCCKLNNTWNCDEHLFRQVSTSTGRYQLLIFGCTECTHEDAPAHNFGPLYIDDIMSYNSLTTQHTKSLYVGIIISCKTTNSYIYHFLAVLLYNFFPVQHFVGTLHCLKMI